MEITLQDTSIEVAMRIFCVNPTVLAVQLVYFVQSGLAHFVQSGLTHLIS